MGKDLIRIIAVILLLAFILYVAFVPALASSIVPDNYVFNVFMHLVFLMLLGVYFFPFTNIVLFTHKLE